MPGKKKNHCKDITVAKVLSQERPPRWALGALPRCSIATTAAFECSVCGKKPFPIHTC